MHAQATLSSTEIRHPKTHATCELFWTCWIFFMRDHDRTSAVPFVSWVQLSRHVSHNSMVGKNNSLNSLTKSLSLGCKQHLAWFGLLKRSTDRFPNSPTVVVCSCAASSSSHCLQRCHFVFTAFNTQFHSKGDDSEDNFRNANNRLILAEQTGPRCWLDARRWSDEKKSWSFWSVVLMCHSAAAEICWKGWNLQTLSADSRQLSAVAARDCWLL